MFELLGRVVGFLLIGLAAGWITGKLMRGKGYGFTGNLAIGVIGSFVGGILFWILGLSAHGIIGSLVMAVGGAVVFLLLVNWLRKP
jgi:uncharacterized membrane protein YeaQ/YmgE (transglycosylase-associated protein family)